MKLLLTVIVTFVVLLGCSHNKGQRQAGDGHSQTPSVFPDARQAANAALSTLMRMSDSGIYRDLGFENASDVTNASLGSPTKIYVLPRAKLAQYKPGMNIRSLFSDIHRTAFPVLANGQAKTLITVQQTPKGWTFVSYGDKALAENLQRVRNDKMSQTASGPGAGPEGYFDLRVQDMHLDFLGIEPEVQGPGNANDVLLTPLTEPKNVVPANLGLGSEALHSTTAAFIGYVKKHPKFTPGAEGVKPASDVLRALAPAAHNSYVAKGPS